MIVAIRKVAFEALSTAQINALEQCTPGLNMFQIPTDLGQWVAGDQQRWVVAAHPAVTESICAQIEYVGLAEGLQIPNDLRTFAQFPEGWTPYVPDDVIPPEPEQ